MNDQGERSAPRRHGRFQTVRDSERPLLLRLGPGKVGGTVAQLLCMLQGREQLGVGCLKQSERQPWRYEQPDKAERECRAEVRFKCEGCDSTIRAVNWPQCPVYRYHRLG